MYTIKQFHAKFSNDQGLKILHLNCQSLTPKVDSIIELNQNNFDLLLFTETWFKNYDNVNCFIGYDCYSLIRDNGYGGVAMYSKNNLKLEIISEFTFITSFLECITALHIQQDSNFLYLSLP